MGNHNDLITVSELGFSFRKKESVTSIITDHTGTLRQIHLFYGMRLAFIYHEG
jgi:hypothetical protein